MADQDDDIDNDVESTDASGDLSVAANDAAPPAMTSSMKMPAAPPPIDLRQYLQNKMLADKQQMADAQKQASSNEMYSGLGRAAAFMSAGLARSNAPVDQKPFDALAATDQQPVTDIQNAQKSQGQDLANQQAAISTQKEIGDADPNSPQSIAAKNMIKKLYPGKFDDKTLEGISAADIGNSIMKPLELDEKIQAHKDEMAGKSADRRDLAGARTDANADKTYTQMRKDLESFRGNQAAQQASLKVQNADTALAIVKGKDPNSLTVQDLRILSDEMGKIATGGVPGEHGTEALMPNNLQTKYAEMKNFLLSSPTDANAGAYIRHNMEYLEQMKAVAQGTLNKYRLNIAKGYKHRVKDEDYNEAMSDYNLGGSGGSDTSASAPAKGGPSLQDLIAEKARRKQAATPAPAPAPAPPQSIARSPQADQPGDVAPASAPGAYQGQVGYAFGGAVQPPGFQHVHQPVQPHLPAPRPVAIPKAPMEQIPLGMKAPERQMHFEHGGTVPGQPQVPFNSPVNDTVTAKLTPKEEVLPLSVTQSHSPSMAAFLHMKSKGYK